MKDRTDQPAVLLLEDGTMFRGQRIGKTGITTGEICFNTGMTGYQEIFTDPSYFGQILVMTNAHIGNYGSKSDEVESDSPKISGLVVKNFSEEYSRQTATSSLQEYLEEQNVVGISAIDTRALVKHIRTKGAMNAIISSTELNKKKLEGRLMDVPDMDGLELSSKVSTNEPYFRGNEEHALRVAVMDWGVKRSILNCMVERQCYVKVFPAKTSYSEVKEWDPDGLFLSNGPGDPASMSYAVDLTKDALEDGIPLFGICLGHQILALGADIPTYKMHHGHRGINHPVLNMETGRGEITSQNHGFGVHPERINEREDSVEVTHVNLNDQSVEGLRIKGKPAFSVQYHPEASPGPHDARYLFDDFVSLMMKYK